MSFAIIETGGKQYKVSTSKILEIEKLSAKKGEIVKIAPQKDQKIEFHINRQYEIHEPGGAYLKSLYKTPEGKQKIHNAREFFRRELLTRMIQGDKAKEHPLYPQAREVQTDG